IEQRGDAGHAVRAIERDFERPNGIPAELVAERQMDDAGVIALGIEILDRAEDVPASHPRLSFTERGAPALESVSSRAALSVRTSYVTRCVRNEARSSRVRANDSTGVFRRGCITDREPDSEAIVRRRAARRDSCVTRVATKD